MICSGAAGAVIKSTLDTSSEFWRERPNAVLAFVSTVILLICKCGIFDAGYGETLCSPHLKWAGKRKFAP